MFGEDKKVSIEKLLNSPQRGIADNPRGIYGRDQNPNKPPLSSSNPQRPHSANPKVRSSISNNGRGNVSNARIHKEIPRNNKNMNNQKNNNNLRDRNEEWKYLISFEREDLASAIVEMKKKYRALQHANSQLKVDNQKTENELFKQQRRIDKLVSPHVNGQSILDIRREIEKSILVRQLKGQINILRETLITKEEDIEKFKKSHKASIIMELTAEKDEYLLEINRLRGLINEKNLMIEEEKRRGPPNVHAHTGRMGTNTEMELRKEIERLSFGYQELLGRITSTNKSNMGETASSKVNIAAVTNTDINSNSPTKKVSSPLKREASPAIATGIITTAPPSISDRFQLAGAASLKGAANELEEDYGAQEVPLEGGQEQGPLNEFGLDTGEAIELDGSPRDDGFDVAADVVPDDNGEVMMTALPTEATISNHKFPLNSKVKARFRGGNNFYNGSIKALNPDGTYSIIYDDGDEEHDVIEENIEAI